MMNPYQAPHANLHYAETETHYVGFWLRVFATLVDSLLISIVLYPLLALFFGWQLEYEGLGLGSTLFSYFLPALVVLLFWYYRSATPGKMLIGAVIVDSKTGLPPTFGQLVLRYLGYWISSVLFCLGFLWIGWDARKQGWHDKIAGTVVIRRLGE